MTAPVLKIDLHNFGKYYFYAVKRLRACLVIQCIAALLSYPLGALVMNFMMDFVLKRQAAYEAYFAEYPNVSMAVQAELDALLQQEDTVLMLIMVFAVIALAALVTVVGMHFITPLISYRRLYDKTHVDMDYSLPVSADAAFWGDFLAGATVTVVPHFLAAIFGLMLLQPVYGKCSEYSDESALILDILNNDVIPLIWTTFLAAIMLYALTILIMGFCGKKFHAVAMPILVNIVVPVVHYLLFWLSMSYAEGNYVSVVYMMEIRSVFVTSPLGMVFASAMGGLLGHGMNSSGYTAVNYYPIQQPRYLIPALVVILLIILGSWLVIRRRRAEQVGARAFTVKPAQYVIHGLTALAVAMVAAWKISRDFDNFYSYQSSIGHIAHIYDVINVYSVPLLIAIPAVYLILEVAAGEAKRFGWSLARCGGTVAAAAGITLAAMCSNGFGTFLKAPDIKNVSSVYVHISQYNTRTDFGYNFKEPENIDKIALLQNSVKSEWEYGNIFVMKKRVDAAIQKGSRIYDIMVDFEYNCRDGYRKDCSLVISEETMAEIMREIALPESMAYKYFTLRRGMEVLGIPVREGGKETLIPLSKSGLTSDMLYEAIRKDCENVTYERMFKCEPGNYVKEVYLALNSENLPSNEILLGDYYSGHIKVCPWSENTLALLSEYGIEVDFGITEEYKTAFIVKSLPEEEDTSDWRYQCYQGQRVPTTELFGLAGDENFLPYYKMRERDISRYDAEIGERVRLTEDDEIMEYFKSEYQNVQAAKIDMEQAKELYPLCGGVYDVDTDYGSDHYALVLTSLTGEDLLDFDDSLPFDSIFVYIPAEYFGKAAEMFDAAA